MTIGRPRGASRSRFRCGIGWGRGGRGGGGGGGGRGGGERRVGRAARGAKLGGGGARRPGGVAGGQKQGVGWSGVVVPAPHFFSAAGPFSNLDPPNARRIVRLL